MYQIYSKLVQGRQISIFPSLQKSNSKRCVAHSLIKSKPPSLLVLYDGLEYHCPRSPQIFQDNNSPRYTVVHLWTMQSLKILNELGSGTLSLQQYHYPQSINGGMVLDVLLLPYSQNILMNIQMKYENPIYFQNTYVQKNHKKHAI